MDEFYLALIDLLDAHADRDKAFEEYDGHSWSYVGQDYETTLEDARKRFKVAFKAAVEEALQ